MRNARLDEAQAGIKISGRNINNLRYADDTTLTAESEEEEKRLLDCKEIKPVSPKRNQPWIFIGRTDAETEALILWPPDWKSWLIGKDPAAGKDWGQEEKVVRQEEMVGWHHRLNGHEFEQPPEIVKDRESWHAAIHVVAKSYILLRVWTTTTTAGTFYWHSLLISII